MINGECKRRILPLSDSANLDSTFLCMERNVNFSSTAVQDCKGHGPAPSRRRLVHSPLKCIVVVGGQRKGAARRLQGMEAF